MLAFLRNCLFGPDDRPKLRPPPRSEAAPFTLLNDSTHEVQVWKNGNGPITRVAPRSSAVIDAERHGGLRFTGVLADAFDARVLDKSTVVVVAHWAPRAAPGLVVRVDDADTRRVDALVAIREAGLLPRALAKVRDRIRRRHSAATALAARARGLVARARARCPCCLDDVPRGVMVKPARSCRAGHDVCRGCARRYLQTSIDDGRMILKCPGAGCGATLTNRDVDVLAGAKLVAKLRTRVVEVQQRRLAELEAATGDDGDFVAWASKDCRACPNCRVIIFRYAGCDHMSCRCGASFNWNTTGLKIGAAHAAPLGRGATWTCGFCTFENSALLPRCEMCRRGRPPSPMD